MLEKERLLQRRFTTILTTPLAFGGLLVTTVTPVAACA